MLAAEFATAIEIKANGPDAGQALESLAELVEARFYRSEPESVM
jgi:phosphotransferase system HPr-like phosphotransfer protein